MYPVVRFVKEWTLSALKPRLPLLGVHVSHHICWPWDLDLWMEMNNGRSLSLYDLGRIPLSGRVGLVGVIRRNGWGMTMAGASVRWRRRIRVFHRFEMRSRSVGWDARFIYLEQTMWRRGEALSSVIYRTAITDRAGIVAPSRVLRELGHTDPAPELPAHVRAWIEAEATRPWPPVV